MTRLVIFRSVYMPTATFGLCAMASLSAFANDGFEYGGYWRVGYNTASAVTAQELVTRKLSWRDFVDTLEGLTGEASDTQDLPGLKTTRHSRNPTYFQLKLGQRFSNGVETRLKLDSFGPMAHDISESTAETTARNSANIRVRDLYLSLPLSLENTRLWAGSRMLEYEDLRLFDGGNPFDLNAYGVGIETSKFEAVLSYNKATRTAVVIGANGQPVANPQQNSNVNTKDVTLLGRFELKPWKIFNVRPMFKFTNHSGAPADSVSTVQRKAINGSVEALVGAVISRTGRPGYWGNTVLAVRETPAGLIGRTDQDETKGDDNIKKNAQQTNLENSAARNAALRGDSKNYDTTFIFTDTSNVDFTRWAMLSGVWVEHDIYNSGRQLWKLSGSTIIRDGENKTKSSTRYSFGIQPVYFISDQVHAAFDLNYAGRTKRLSNNDANGIIITPIIRYAMNKSALGTPQIYASLSYGRYDAETKRQPNGSFKTTLVTTQSGFEIWF
jgi:maltoporin